jgi:hypothetical protein
MMGIVQRLIQTRFNVPNIIFIAICVPLITAIAVASWVVFSISIENGFPTMSNTACDSNTVTYIILGVAILDSTLFPLYGAILVYAIISRCVPLKSEKTVAVAFSIFKWAALIAQLVLKTTGEGIFKRGCVSITLICINQFKAIQRWNVL